MSPPYAAFLVEAHSYTHRSDPLPVITACHSQRFPIAALVSLLVPRFTVAYQHFLECDVSMTNGYFGILGITSLFMILFLGQLRKMWRWLLAWMGIAFLFSLGTEGGIRIAAYYVLPTLNYMRHSSIFRAFWLFGGATLLGLALGKVLVADNAEKRNHHLTLHQSVAARTVHLFVYSFVGFGCAGSSLDDDRIHRSPNWNCFSLYYPILLIREGDTDGSIICGNHLDRDSCGLRDSSL